MRCGEQDSTRAGSSSPIPFALEVGGKARVELFFNPEVPSIVLASGGRSVAEWLSAVALEDNVQADFNSHHVSGGASS